MPEMTASAVQLANEFEIKRAEDLKELTALINLTLKRHKSKSKRRRKQSLQFNRLCKVRPRFFTLKSSVVTVLVMAYSYDTMIDSDPIVYLDTDGNVYRGRYVRVLSTIEELSDYELQESVRIMRYALKRK